MKAKVQEREQAIQLRREGFSYNDILREIPVAKSTLSNWLKDLPLTNEEKQTLKKRRNSNISRGRIRAATANRRNRLEREKQWLEEAKKEFEQNSNDPFFYVGISLYWAEGTKRNGNCSFVNSDLEMVSVFVSWLETFAQVPRETLYYRLYLHKSYDHENCEQFWANGLRVSVSTFKRTVYKSSKSLVKKRPSYKGCMQMDVPRGKKLLYKLKVWQNMLVCTYDK